MTTVQTMLAAARVLAAASAFTLALSPIGCASGKDRLVPPEALISPYSTRTGDVLWAVAPLANESGTSIADGLAVSDTLVNKINEVEGITAVPMNRTLMAMRALGISRVSTPADARAIADAVGADAVLVGTVTSYDPYNPPKLGMALALFSRRAAPGGDVDPMRLQTAYSDDGTIAPSSFDDRPLAVVTQQYEGGNHGVQMAVQRYATGRLEGRSSLGWKRYLASMDLYTEFAAHETLRRLLDEERLRLAREPQTSGIDRR